ncbi:hypothetical protein K502DRAFT_366539 [Neoconidiobolus thromboides FSU 785]|nr:hypothetical protein K502DRAFT_366539 [Neoconidiobolus thromboides FSU 785]
MLNPIQSILLFYYLIAIITCDYSIITLLSSKPEFKEMIYLLQESRMIPIINRLNGTTLLALTNDKLKDVDKLYPTRKDKEELIRYHLMEGNFTKQQLVDSYNNKNWLVETYLYKEEGVEGLLGVDQGQRVKVEYVKEKDKLMIGDVKVVETDLLTKNGIIHVVDNYIIPPKKTMEIIKNHPNLTYFYEWIKKSEEIETIIDEGKSMNLFLFEDNSISKMMNSIELNYLNNLNYALKDRSFLVNSFLINNSQPPVIYNQYFNNNLSLPIITVNLAGSPVIINGLDNNVYFNHMLLNSTDILTRNGVIHLLSKPQLPYGLNFDGMKYLIGMNATKFYDYAKNSSVENLVNSKKDKYTILIPPNNAFELFNNDRINEDILYYHILKGLQNRSTLNNTGLIITMLDSDNELKVQQRIKIKHRNGEIILNDMSNLIGDTYNIKNTNLIQISSLLEIPPDLFNYLNKETDLSNFLQLIKSSPQLEEYLLNLTSFTGLFPNNMAFANDNQEILTNYLLMNSSSELLTSIIKFNLIKYPTYSTAFEHGDLSLITMYNDTKISVNRQDNQIQFVSNTTNHFDGIPILYESDQLVRSGVIHKTNQLLIPPTLFNNLTAYQIIRANSAKTFLYLMKLANLTNLLTDKNGPIKTLLIPSDEAFSNVNMTLLTTNIELLNQTLQFHLLTERLPTHLNSLNRLISIPTISNTLKNLKILFLPNNKLSDNNFKNNKIHIRTEGAPAPLYQFEASILTSGQAYDMSIAIIDSVLFIPPIDNKYSLLSLFRDLVLAIGGLGTLYGVGYLAYYRYFPIRANGYQPIEN